MWSQLQLVLSVVDQTLFNIISSIPSCLKARAVFYVCLGTDGRASHMIGNDPISGWLKQVMHEQVILPQEREIQRRHIAE